ncbi:hypothetical protein A2U01_0095224, partial [Trifolium medium]|nr:hypothetical protein [Trifolium medium]
KVVVQKIDVQKIVSELVSQKGF